MGIQTPTSRQSFSGDISKATLSRYNQIGEGLQHHNQRVRVVHASRLSNNYVFVQSNGVSASNTAIRKHIARAAAQKKNGKKDEKKALLEVAPRINRASKASAAGEVWQKVDFLKVGPKLTAASQMTVGEVWQGVDFLEVGPKITNVVMRVNQKSVNQTVSADLRMVKEKELMQLGDNNNLRKLYDDMNVNLNNHGSTIVKDVGSVITYEIDVPCTHNAHSQNTYRKSQPAQAVVATEKKIITIDMKNKFQQPNGQETHGKVHIGRPEQKPDITVKMSADTFDKLSSKELGGFKAYVTGQLSFDGNLSALKKFDSKVVAKY